MKKKIGILKRMSCLLLIFLLSINSFAAIVSDNDGSAFITKAEFDALKSSFQAQIDSYNQSIDSKIDGAIASYLAGIKLSSTLTHDSLVPSYWTLPLRSLKSWQEMANILQETFFKIDVTAMASLTSSGGYNGAYAIIYKCPARPAPFGFRGVDETDAGSVKVKPYRDVYLDMRTFQPNYWGSSLSWGANAKTDIYWLCGIAAPMYDCDNWTPDNILHNKSNNIIKAKKYVKAGTDWHPCGLNGNLKWDNQGWYFVNGYIEGKTTDQVISDTDLAKLPKRMRGETGSTSQATGPVIPTNGAATVELTFYGGLLETIPYIISSADAVVPCWLDGVSQNCGMVYIPDSYFSDRHSNPAFDISQLKYIRGDSAPNYWGYNSLNNAVPLWPTWGSFKSTEIQSYDTLRYGKNLVLDEPCDIDSSSTDYRLHGGVAINKMQGTGSMEFEATFGNMASSGAGEMKILFKKNGWFTQSEIDSLTTISYTMDGVPVTTPTWVAGNSTHNFKFEGLEKGDYVVMQWVSNDSDFGGILQSVGMVTETLQN